MEIVTSLGAIVPEVLKEDNYERWSILMKYYLVTQDLWNVVQSSKKPAGGNKRELMKKNALALHAIGISCGREAFDQIKNIDSAKGAWDALAAKLKPPPIGQRVTSDVSEPHQERQTEELEGLVCYGPISVVKQFFCDHPDQKSSQVLDSALKLAITCGRKKLAHYLYLEILLVGLQRGDSDFLLLEHCITKRMFDIALDLLHHFPNLVSKHPANHNPIVLTLAQTAPPFLSLNELGYWGRWIYKSIEVEDVEVVFATNVAHGAKPSSSPIVLDNRVVIAEVHLYGDVVLCYISYKNSASGFSLRTFSRENPEEVLQGEPNEPRSEFFFNRSRREKKEEERRRRKGEKERRRRREQIYRWRTQKQREGERRAKSAKGLGG
ncbi:hypothetical protein SLEP1_g15287 [Rubroshorea leprosula]|uniref:DUF4219 domain-containing protein n=1 Tax=Rubroshorea leprosula TaxID=152421 RepID=A0AAV5ISU8_9ROSI|nr:hypothetical protein SLEP1_g15287 [Rubroshorea leprosula]